MKFRVSPLVFIMALVFVFFGYGFEFACYLLTILIHEMTHAEVSKRLGYALNEIKLMPYGASLTGVYEGVKWSHEVLIALAGPLINIILAVIFIAVWWLIPSSYFITELFVYCNITNALFNLIPIYPLDGGRTLLAFLSKYIKREKVYKTMRICGIFAALLFALLFAMTLIYKPNFSLATIAIFIFTSTIIPDKKSKYQRLYSVAYRMEKLKSGLTVKEIMVPLDATILQLTRMLNSNYYHRFIIMDKNFKKVGEITESELESAAAKYDHLIKLDIFCKNI